MILCCAKRILIPGREQQRKTVFGKAATSEGNTQQSLPKTKQMGVDKCSVARNTAPMAREHSTAVWQHIMLQKRHAASGIYGHETAQNLFKILTIFAPIHKN